MVYRAYDGMIEFPTVEILGRRARPAVGLAQLDVDTRHRDSRPFDLVYLLDVEEDQGRAVRASEVVFLQTVNRSGFTFLQ